MSAIFRWAAACLVRLLLSSRTGRLVISRETRKMIAKASSSDIAPGQTTVWYDDEATAITAIQVWPFPAIDADFYYEMLRRSHVDDDKYGIVRKA